MDMMVPSPTFTTNPCSQGTCPVFQRCCKGWHHMVYLPPQNLQQHVIWDTLWVGDPRHWLQSYGFASLPYFSGAPCCFPHSNTNFELASLEQHFCQWCPFGCRSLESMPDPMLSTRHPCGTWPTLLTPVLGGPPTLTAIVPRPWLLWVCRPAPKHIKSVFCKWLISNSVQYRNCKGAPCGKMGHLCHRSPSLRKIGK